MDRENIKRGTFLKEVRTANLLSEQELAELVGVDPADVTVWETGIKFPDDNLTLDKLAKTLNVTKRELLNGEFKKNKDDNIIEVKFDDDKKKKQTTETINIDNKSKNILLVVLSCLVLFILVGTVISVSQGSNVKKAAPKEKIVVSDEREPVTHVPHTSNEHIIYNTQAADANQDIYYDGSRLVDYGFTKSGNTYSKSTSKYRIVYKSGVFDIILHTYGSKLHMVRNIKDGTFLYTSSNGTRTVIVDIPTPSGFRNCDKEVCVSNNDYYKYINLLVSVIGG